MYVRQKATYFYVVILKLEVNNIYLDLSLTSLCRRFFSFIQDIGQNVSYGTSLSPTRPNSIFSYVE